jgi:hypothetical protein
VWGKEHSRISKSSAAVNLDASAPPGKRGKQLFNLLKADAVKRVDKSVGFLMTFLIHCFWFSKALWGKTEEVIAVIAKVTMSIVKGTALPSASTTGFSAMDASKVVKDSPLSTVLMMAILSSGVARAFCVQTSMISLWRSIHCCGEPSSKSAKLFLYLLEVAGPPASALSSMVMKLVLSSVLGRDSGNKGKRGENNDDDTDFLCLNADNMLILLFLFSILILVRRFLKAGILLYYFAIIML